MKFCTIDGCDNQHAAKGLCDKHYKRKLRNGQGTGNVRNVGRLCFVKGCNESAKVKGFCNQHYHQNKKWIQQAENFMEYEKALKEIRDLCKGDGESSRLYTIANEALIKKDHSRGMILHQVL